MLALQVPMLNYPVAKAKGRVQGKVGVWDASSSYKSKLKTCVLENGKVLAVCTNEHQKIFCINKKNQGINDKYISPFAGVSTCRRTCLQGTTTRCVVPAPSSWSTSPWARAVTWASTPSTDSRPRCAAGCLCSCTAVKPYRSTCTPRMLRQCLQQHPPDPGPRRVGFRHNSLTRGTCEDGSYALRPESQAHMI